MHPAVRQDRPGLCSECGMNLVAAGKGKSGKPREYNKHQGHGSGDMFIKK